MVLVFKIAWGTLRKRSKSMIFAREIMFPKCIISKKFRLRRATLPAMFNLYSARAPPTQSFFKFTGGYRALYTCTKRFYKLAEVLRLGYIIFTGGYRALYTCTKLVWQSVIGTGRKFIVFDSRAVRALTHSFVSCRTDPSNNP